MALDEALLNAAVGRGFSALRLYQWCEPTISTGHFQPLNDPIVAERFPNLARVRRLSGGGAILHHHELTYSCVLPASHDLTRNPNSIYERIHEVIIDVLGQSGIDCQLRGTPQPGPDPFLCFGRGDPRDIVIGADKIVGSAQRRRQGAVLQHGAILLARSPYAPECPGIVDLTNIALAADFLAEQLRTPISAILGQPHELDTWPHEVVAAAEELVNRYQPV